MTSYPAPAGVVTFLFTDIEGSTRLWEAYPEPMRLALARHDHLLGEIISGEGGRVFKTVGDAFCASFLSPQRAVRAALQIQRQLAQEDWGPTPIKVRAAVHSGAAEERDNDYFGPTLNLIARLLSTGYGGQVLVSQATREILRDDLPPELSLRDLGTHRLKDIARPERIFQIVSPGLPDAFPPLKSLDIRTSNLPVELSSFIGRQREVADLLGLLGSEAGAGGARPAAASRLVTLTGPGGTGKTRLALEVGSKLLPRFGQGVWLVELASVRDQALLPATVASALELRLEPGQPVETSLVNRLSDWQGLIVLDNCEHLVEACAALAALLLRHCRGVSVLATSREPLAIAGEVVYPVGALALPTLQQDLPPDALLQFDAVRLFVERAVAARPDFQLARDNAAAVARVCRRLDGIPLALELAAARTRTLKVDQIAARLDDRFRLLSSGSRAALPHHQTLRATIDWSYDLLTEPERTLLGRLSVFRGGCRLDEAEAVCGDSGRAASTPNRQLDPLDVLDLLDRLVGKSLVVVDYGETSGARYRMLETIREYAGDRLAEAGEAELLSDRHLRVYLQLVEEAAPVLEGADQAAWMDRLEAEIDNLRAALRWARDGRRGELGPTLAFGLVQFWYTRGYYAEGREQLEAMLPFAPPDTALRAHMLEGIAFLARYQGDFAAVEASIEQSLAIWRRIGNRQGIADSLANVAFVALYRGEYELARDLYEQSLAVSRELGNGQSMADALSHLGMIAFFLGELDSALALHAESLAIWRDLGDGKGVAYALRYLADTSLHMGRRAEAQQYTVECLRTALPLDYKEVIAGALEIMAALVVAREPRLALRVATTADRLRGEIGAPIPPGQRVVVEERLRPARASLPAADVEALPTMSLAEAVAWALATPLP